MLLSVVVVNWNSRDDVHACLESLRAQTHPELEVIVVDNGLVDGWGDLGGAEFPEFTLLQQTENLGFAEACNRGIDASHGEWVAMLNNDAVAEPAWAKALATAASTATRDCGMLQSLLLYQGRTGVINSTGIELTYAGGGRDRDGNKHCDAVAPERNVFCPTAGAAAYRREMLDVIKLPTGYFDRSHFMYYEDLDLGWRARLAGYSAAYVPASVVHHKWHGSSSRHGRAWLEVISCINRQRTLLKNASGQFILRTTPRTALELAKIIWFGRLGGIMQSARAVRESVNLRTSVEAMAKIGRRQVEAEWTEDPS